MKEYKIGRVIKSNVNLKTLTAKVINNLKALQKCLEYVGNLQEELRMFRIGSDLLPWFDSEDFNHLYKDERLSFIIENGLVKCKKIIEDKGIRVTTHPDKKASVFNSDKAHVRQNALRCLEYHYFFMSRLQSHEDGAIINIHIHGKLDHFPLWDEISEGCKNYLSLENDENKSSGVIPTLEMCEKYGVKFVYDIHHDLAENCGKSTIDFKSDTMKRILNTWGDVRPHMHISDCLNKDATTTKSISPHSEYITDEGLIRKCKSMLDIADVDVEAKAKQLSVYDLKRRLECLSQ